MDNYSVSAVARVLGVGRATVRRAQTALGLPAGAVTSAGLASLRDKLGAVPLVPGMSREEVLVAAALARRPLGLRSVRAVASTAGISPTTASKVLRVLLDAGLVTRRRERAIEGRGLDVDVWYPALTAPAWLSIDDAVRHTVLPVHTVATGRSRCR
jgi:DNA-binding transcriptional ArsR family regulator